MKSSQGYITKKNNKKHDIFEHVRFLHLTNYQKQNVKEC